MVAPVFNAVNPLAGPSGLTRGVLPGDSIATRDSGTAKKVADTPGAEIMPQVNYLWYILGIVGLLVALRYAGEKSDDVQPTIAGVGIYNFFVVGIMSMLFLLTGKVIFNKWRVKGVTELFNAA